MDIPETIKKLQSKIANETTLGGKEINDLTEALEQVGFALTTFENLDERLGFNDFLSECTLADNPYTDHNECLSWVNGWNKAKNHPYVKKHMNYYWPPGSALHQQVNAINEI